MLKNLIDEIRNRPNLPNKFTIALGNLIREARLEAKMSQSDLAERSYLSQTAISQIELTKRAVSAEEIIYLSHALNKPLLYFFPKELIGEVNKSDLDPLELELLQYAKKLSPEDLKKLIAQTRALTEYDNLRITSR